jgi:hypothetical protein
MSALPPLPGVKRTVVMAEIYAQVHRHASANQDTPIICRWHAAGLGRQHRRTKVRPVCKRRAVGLGASTNGTTTFVLMDAPC